MSNTKKTITIAGVAALIITAVILVYTLVFYVRLQTGTPKNEDWKNAARYIYNHWHKTDYAAITPQWAYQGESAIRNLRQIMTQNPQDESYPDADRLWVISIQGRFDKGRKIMLARPGVTLEEEKHFGAVTVDLLKFADIAKVKFDFVQHIDQAEVYVMKQKHKNPCGPMRNDRFTCEPNSWSWVGKTHRFIGNAKRTVIWAHPIADSLNIQFYDVMVGTKLRINTALSLFAATLPEGTPVIMDVYVGGKLMKTLVQPNTAKMQHFEIDLGDLSNHLRDVRFVIHSENNGRRHFMFQAYTI